MHNLTSAQKEVLQWLIQQIREHKLPEDFHILWFGGTKSVIFGDGQPGLVDAPNITRGTIDAFIREQLLWASDEKSFTVTAKAYEAVDSNFQTSDVTFMQHLTPLADISGFDAALQQRCLPLLLTGGADPKIWDSAVRTAGVILEERLRDVGQITNSSRVGRDLVNDVFGQQGTLAPKFEHDGERVGYRDLFAGVVGAFRNPYAHRLIDPHPENGGAFIVFVNLLLKMLEDLRKKAS